MLSLFIESQGRINSGSIVDLKGITGNVSLGTGVINDWNMTGFPFDNITKLQEELTSLASDEVAKQTKPAPGVPGFWIGKIEMPCSEAKDTFLKMTNWAKGERELQS